MVDDISEIANVFHAWRKGEGYQDVVGKYCSVTTENITKQQYVLTPGRYVGVQEDEDTGNFFGGF